MNNKSTKLTKTQTIPVSLIKAISKSNFTVYLAESKEDNTKYAMKVFPFIKAEINPCYIRESRLFNKPHPNIIKIADHEDFIETITPEGKKSVASYILMELAPYDDLAEFMLKEKLPMCEKMNRTIFHQIVEGVKFLHDNDLAHCDLKLENVLIGDNYMMKIADFDSLCYMSQREKVTRAGSPNYRAPEVITKKINNLEAVDIYSLGIILLVLMFREFPYSEDSLYRGNDLRGMLLESDDEYWKVHPSGSSLSSNNLKKFKELIFGLVKKNPEERLTLKQVMESEWYKGPVYTKYEYITIMSKCDH